MNCIFKHPALGDMLPEDTDWVAAKARVPFASLRIEVCLAGEEGAAGPSPTALAGYDWISSHWPDVFKLIEGQAYDFYEPYRDAVPTVPQFTSSAELYGTEEVIGLRLWSETNFEVSVRFAWQEAEDPHIVTFYVEDRICLTHSVDGWKTGLTSR